MESLLLLSRAETQERGNVVRGAWCVVGGGRWAASSGKG